MELAFRARTKTSNKCAELFELSVETYMQLLRGNAKESAQSSRHLTNQEHIIASPYRLRSSVPIYMASLLPHTDCTFCSWNPQKICSIKTRLFCSGKSVWGVSTRLASVHTIPWPFIASNCTKTKTNVAAAPANSTLRCLWTTPTGRSLFCFCWLYSRSF